MNDCHKTKRKEMAEIITIIVSVRVAQDKSRSISGLLLIGHNKTQQLNSDWIQNVVQA